MPSVKDVIPKVLMRKFDLVIDAHLAHGNRLIVLVRLIHGLNQINTKPNSLASLGIRKALIKYFDHFLAEFSRSLFGTSSAFSTGARKSRDARIDCA